MISSKLSDRQHQIIHASLELISEKGIQGLTMKNLSVKIGLVESAIYRHYRSKSSILEAILDFMTSQNQQETSIQGKPVIPILMQRFSGHFASFSKNPSLVSVVFAEELFPHEPVLIEKTKEKIQQSLKDLAGLIRQGQQQGELRQDIDPEQVSVIVNGSIRMLVKRWKMADFSFDLVVSGENLLTTLITLLKP